MGKVRVAGFAVSIDGFGAGPDQSLEHPLGIRGEELHNWFYPTRAFRSMTGQDGGIDDRFASAASIPSVTKWKVVPPSITMGAREWWVRMKVGA